MPTLEPGSEAEGEAAAAALASLRAAVRQRQAELAATPGGSDELGVPLAEMRRHEFVQEPRPVSPRRGVGSLIVLARKAAYHLFVKWYARAVLQQQNEFNQSSAALLASVVERDREARSELARLRSRIEELEARARRAPADEAPG